MSFATAYDLTSDGAFRQRVTAAAVKVSIDVAAEDIGTPGHADRLALAVKVLNDPETWTRVLIFGITANSTIQSKPKTVEDAEIEFTLASIWDAYAGVIKARSLDARVV